VRRTPFGAIALAIALSSPRVFAQADDDLEIPASPSPSPAPAPAPVPVPAPDPPPVPATGLSAGPRTPSATTGAPTGGTKAASVFLSPDAIRPDVHGVPEEEGLVVSGYIQSQFERGEISEDERLQGGAPINVDRFLVRRGRLRVDRRWSWAAAAIEFDGSTTRGPFFGVRRAEASLIYAGNPAPGEPPLATLTAGLTEVPFGHELVESSRSRWFMERSTASLAFFPGEPDVGVRLQGGIGPFRYAIALLNGEPLDDRAGRGTGGREFNKAKDLVARVGVDVPATRKLRIAGGVSILEGKGFRAGTDATKPGVAWRDLNENSLIESVELTPVPGTAATPSVNFDRWAVGADLRFALETGLGLTRLFGEIYVASNLDRGIFFADPIANGGDIRHLGWYVAALQEFGRHVIVGARLDVYDPNSDILDRRGGRFVPADQTIRTFSPLVGLVLPGRARLLAQYDLVRDKLARDVTGVPIDLRNDLFVVRLQVEL
jgi:hypothetical protein